jgi:hypothetical protein
MLEIESAKKRRKDGNANREETNWSQEDFFVIPRRNNRRDKGGILHIGLAATRHVASRR